VLFVTDSVQLIRPELCKKRALEGFGDFTIRGDAMRTVKYADELVLLIKEETVLQGVRVVERCFGSPLPPPQKEQTC
jgi:hypothetical protein